MEVLGLTYQIRDRALLQSVNLQVREGELVGVVGPNGSGKSTLLKNIYRVLTPHQGQVIVGGRNIHRMGYKESSTQLAVVAQETASSFDFTVQEVVAMGRLPYKRWLEADNQNDQVILEEALEQVGMLAYANRSFSTLSGGEKQRVLIARALAQKAKLLILDEPTNHLDIRHQLQVMDLLKSLKLTALAALHDLNIAAFYCDQLYVLQAGEVVASGAPGEVLTPALLWDVFGVAAEITVHPYTGKPTITYLPELLQHR